MISRKSVFVIAWHLFFWILYTGLVFMIIPNRTPYGFSYERIILVIAFHIPMAYLNSEVLIPRFYLKKHYLPYLLISIIILIMVTWVIQEVSQPIPPQLIRPMLVPRPIMPGGLGEPPGFFPFRIHNIIVVFLGTVIFLFSSVFKLSQISNRREQEAVQLRNENLQSELKFLKSQINPHFLFNTLNNIYTLSLVKSEKASDIILKLSEMLRYVIYECNENEKVPISREVDYIKHYIDLQLLRDSSITSVTFNPVIEYDYPIAPMIFIPFVENSFKHSYIEDTGSGWIRIDLVSGRDAIEFNIENSLSRLLATKDSTSGIGIENVRKRLNLICHSRHTLDIRRNGRSFQVKLKILP